MNKVFFIAVLAISGFFVANSASAAAVINSVKVNGADKTTIEAGAPITATINVSLTSPSVWKSTAYRFGDGNWNCVDTPDHAGNTAAAETFLITAPTKQGTSDVNFEVFENNNCTNGLDMASVPASASLSVAVINVLSFGTGKTWLSVVLLALILIVAALVIFYIIRGTIYKKIKVNSEDK